ncbi:MAG: hypothetical protein ACOCZK_05770 [Planctomycetota bacterium]
MSEEPSGWRHPLLPRAPKTRSERLELVALGFAWSVGAMALVQAWATWGRIDAAAARIAEQGRTTGPVVSVILALGDRGHLLLLAAMTTTAVLAAYRLHSHAARIGIPVACLVLLFLYEIGINGIIVAAGT